MMTDVNIRLVQHPDQPHPILGFGKDGPEEGGGTLAGRGQK